MSSPNAEMQPICDDFFEEAKSPAGSSSAHLNPFVRAYLDEVRGYLLKLHDGGAPARRVNEEHAELIDRLVRKLFRLAENQYFAHFPRLNFRFAVVATGGYGRRELSLGSDIDLLFLYRGKINPYVETIAETLTYRLFDARLQAAPATRTIRECMRLGAEDLSTLTSLLDARFLIGDPGLYAELEREVRDALKEDPEAFISAKLDEQRKRHERFGESLYLLQPNLRESVGGLRDYHTALWIGRAAIWEVRRAEHLLVHGFVDQDEYDALEVSLEFFWRIRNELHRSGRKDDRLHYDAQERLARYLGLEDSEEVLAVEDFMRRYYLHARSIERVSTSVADHVRQVRKQRLGVSQLPTQPVAEGFAIVGSQLEIPNPSLLHERPKRLLAAFAVAQHHDVDLSSRALRMIRQNLDLIDDEFRSDTEAADLFRRVLGAPTRVYRMLKQMDEAGVLGAYLPEFGRLVGMWQQDLYHTYTVDVHSLFLVEQLRRLYKGLYRDELTLAIELIREVRSPVVLYLSCMLHDIGKGLGGGHSGKGARMVPDILARLGIEGDDADTVRFLVLHHLTMSGMADKRDVNDYRLILKLASLCKTRRRLRLLYLITVADIRSVSSEAWTSWKAGLLEQLYRNTAEWFEAGEDRAAASQFYLKRAMKRAAETEQIALEQLERAGGDPELARAFLEVMPRRYLLEHEATEITAHLAAGVDYFQSGTALGVYTFGSSSAGETPFWGVMIMSKDRPGLFASATGVISACRHEIHTAHAYTTRNGNAVEIYRLAPIAGGDAEEELERERIQFRLQRVLDEGGGGVVRSTGPIQTLLPSMRVSPPRVTATNDDSDFYTIIDVETNDRHSLLYDITRTLAELGLEIVTSRASTRANRASDAFFVTENGLKIADSARLRAVEKALAEAIR